MGGSKDHTKVTAVAVIAHDLFSARLPNETINTTEAKTIQLAFEYIKISDKHFTIFSDPLCMIPYHKFSRF